MCCAGETDFADKPALEVCYLRHAFGLGEHYNSTKRLLPFSTVEGKGEEEGQEEEGEGEQQEAVGEEAAL